MNFTNKNVVITGGSTGIGLATAKAFINAGANVLITGKNPDNLQKAAAEVNNPKLKTIVSDTSDLTGIAALESAIAEAGNQVDVLYLNAGIAKFASIENTTEEEFDSQFNTNVKGLFFTLQKLIPHLANGSSVLLTSSVVATGALANAGAYSATKAAVNAIGRIAANELAVKNIRVNIVSPGPIDTPIFGKSLPHDVIDNFKAGMSENGLIKRLGKPEEIADTVLFLASESAANITGVELLVDGGRGLRM
ncbi:SDR family oxidoreductase [Taibaiella lutea]|uniref:SDR family oxidoreductase n=1 Tax=Taibaiella lutea TaxID=2608001 RepID=A0A5M6CED7_9BACT|nr:SDR family oxidoreductase [Taibaiella lutea]KAA5533548.1 SDR family oxidoreductase [Taibaiella lutea]